jgi:hypothetical protein
MQKVVEGFAGSHEPKVSEEPHVVGQNALQCVESHPKTSAFFLLHGG